MDILISSKELTELIKNHIEDKLKVDRKLLKVSFSKRQQYIDTSIKILDKEEDSIAEKINKMTNEKEPQKEVVEEVETDPSADEDLPDQW
jgi:hypothetical protein